MEKRRQNGPWWGFALPAVCCWALGVAWVPLHLENLEGLDVMVALVWLASAVVWTVRAAGAFRRRNAPEDEGRD